MGLKSMLKEQQQSETSMQPSTSQELLSKVTAAQAEIEQLTQKYQQRQELIDQQQRRIEQLEQENREYREANGKISSERSTLQSRLDELLPKISTLQSTNQELTSQLTTAQSEIEQLTQRAASVNTTSLENEKLKSEAKEAKAEKDKAVAAAQRDRQRADRASADAYQARQEKTTADQKRWEAEDKVKIARGGELRTQRRYAALFLGIGIFTVAIAVMELIQRRAALVECGAWFAARASGLKTLFLSLKTLFLTVAAWISGILPEIFPAFSGYVLAGLVAVVVIGVVVGLLVALWQSKISEIISYTKMAYYDGVFKAILTVAVAVALFYICLFFAEPIMAALPLNIFSVWLIAALISTLIINARELVEGVKRGWRGY